VQRPLGDDDASPRQQVADLDRGDALVDELLDVAVLGLEDRPAVASAGPPTGLDGLDHRRYQLVAELVLTTVALCSQGLCRLHVALHGLAVDTGPDGYPAEPFVAAQPPPEHFFHLDH
jgi:hypothetical protein